MNKKKGLYSQVIFTITMVFVLSCLLSSSLWSAKKVDFYSANAAGYIRLLNENHGGEMGHVFGLTGEEDFKLLSQRTDFNGVTHYRYQQVYKDIPVWGIQTVVSRNSANKVVGLHGAVVKGIPNDVKEIPLSLDASGALRRNQELHKQRNMGAAWTFSKEKYGTYIYLHKNEKAYLCSVVSFFADNECGNPSQPVHFTDVNSGKVLHSFDSLNYVDCTGPGGNLKTGYYYYGTDYPPLQCSQDGSTCTLETPDVKTCKWNGPCPFAFPCYENTCCPVNGAYSPLNDAHFFGQSVYDMYWDWYGAAVLPFQLTIICNYSTNYENIFFDGSTLYIGDGNIICYPLAALDAISHEISHGFTEYNSGLIYASQPGGINESFSDQAGEAAEYYVRGSNDFMVGYDIIKDPDGALRYMYDPPLDGISIDHVADYYEGMDVHYSSGIFNKAFYLIATSSGWNTKMAFDIFVKANQDYWTPGTNFQQGAEGALAAALDYGYPSADVVNAFAAVGINFTTSTEIFVEDITVTIEQQGKRYRVIVVVTILDTNGNPVANATVYITWSGVVSGTGSGITGADGTVAFSSPWLKVPCPITITVGNVTHPTLTYNPALNKVTSVTIPCN